MDFRLLGPLAVADRHRTLALGGVKQRSLLAVLLLHANEVVAADRLIEELWGESPPPTAGKALNVHVSQLRNPLVRNGGSAIATRPPGYVGYPLEGVSAAVPAC